MDNSIPYGYCHCGCKQLTRVAARNDRTTDRIKGEPMRYVRGHNGRGKYKNTGSGYYMRFCIIETGYKTPCWIWQQSTGKKGYASLRHDGESKKVHRLHYEYKYGPIPQGLQLDHLCRQPSCVNPDHVEPVTHVENLRRGRLAKLDIKSVREIRSLHATGNYSQLELGRMFGVTNFCIWTVVHRKVWKDV